jgi:hypothetical protein
MIAEIDLLGKVEAFFHTYTEICYSFDLFTSFRVDCKLRHPERIDELLSIFDYIIEDQIQKDK